MNENARLWLEALRNGGYKQGRGWLCRGELYCCLGVACEVASKNGIAVSKKEVNYGYSEYNGEESILPTLVQDWLGLKSVNGLFGKEVVIQTKEPQTLAAMNDNGIPFKDIADFIEANAEKLFQA